MLFYIEISLAFRWIRYVIDLGHAQYIVVSLKLRGNDVKVNNHALVVICVSRLCGFVNHVSYFRFVFLSKRR